MRGIVKVAAVGHGLRDRRKAMLQDIAFTLTGGTVISEEIGMELEKAYGRFWVRRNVLAGINKDTTTIIDGVGEESAIRTAVLLESVSRLKKRPPTTIVKNCRSA